MGWDAFRVKKITTAVQGYDSKLYCGMTREGKPCIFRKSNRWEAYDLGNNNTLLVSQPSPHLIMALTHDWSINGETVEWGILPILKKLQESDNAKRNVTEEWIADHNKEKQSDENARRNNMESFARYEFMGAFKKDCKDINTANLKKEIKSGYRK